MKRIGLVVIISLAFLVWPVLAQEGPTLESLEIVLWPEYDRPDMLVIYHGLFEPDTLLPVSVEIRIPARVGEPTAVAYVTEDGQRLNQQYTTRVEGDEQVVSFQLISLGFQLEYYDTLQSDISGRREYTFTYTADYPIAQLGLEFQVPPTADNYQIDPPADSVAPQADGLTYHTLQVGAMERGETGTWVLSYDKDNSDLTVSSFVQAQPTTSVPAANDQEGLSDVLLFLVAFVALLAVGAAAFWLGRRTHQPGQEVAPRKQKRRGSGQGQQSALRGGIEAYYCHKCGAQLRPDSDFCHKCGAAVRKEN